MRPSWLIRQNKRGKSRLFQAVWEDKGGFENKGGNLIQFSRGRRLYPRRSITSIHSIWLLLIRYIWLIWYQLFSKHLSLLAYFNLFNGMIGVKLAQWQKWGGCCFCCLWVAGSCSPSSPLMFLPRFLFKFGWVWYISLKFQLYRMDSFLPLDVSATIFV